MATNYSQSQELTLAVDHKIIITINHTKNRQPSAPSPPRAGYISTTSSKLKATT